MTQRFASKNAPRCSLVICKLDPAKPSRGFMQMLSVKRSKEAELQSDSNYDDKEVIASGCNSSLLVIVLVLAW